jgi:hypothetical protein
MTPIGSQMNQTHPFDITLGEILAGFDQLSQDFDVPSHPIDTK